LRGLARCPAGLDPRDDFGGDVVAISLCTPKMSSSLRSNVWDQRLKPLCPSMRSAATRTRSPGAPHACRPAGTSRRACRDRLRVVLAIAELRGRGLRHHQQAPLRAKRRAYFLREAVRE